MRFAALRRPADTILFAAESLRRTELLHTFYTGQLWFVLYLFIISLAALPIMYFWTKSDRTSVVEKIPLPVLCLLFVVPYLLLPVGNWGGDMSLGRYFFYFILGFLVISNERVQDRLVTWRRSLLVAALFSLAVHMVTMFSVMQDGLPGLFAALNVYELLWNEAAAMLCALTLTCYGKQFLESHNAKTDTSRHHRSRSMFFICPGLQCSPCSSFL